MSPVQPVHVTIARSPHCKFFNVFIPDHQPTERSTVRERALECQSTRCHSKLWKANQHDVTASIGRPINTMSQQANHALQVITQPCLSFPGCMRVYTLYVSGVVCCWTWYKNQPLIFSCCATNLSICREGCPLLKSSTPVHSGGP